MTCLDIRETRGLPVFTAPDEKHRTREVFSMFFQEPLISEVHVVNGKSKPKATLSFTGGAGTPFSREPIGKRLSPQSPSATTN